MIDSPPYLGDTPAATTIHAAFRSGPTAATGRTSRTTRLGSGPLPAATRPMGSGSSSGLRARAWCRRCSGSGPTGQICMRSTRRRPLFRGSSTGDRRRTEDRYRCREVTRGGEPCGRSLFRTRSSGSHARPGPRRVRARGPGRSSSRSHRASRQRPRQAQRRRHDRLPVPARRVLAGRRLPALRLFGDLMVALWVKVPARTETFHDSG